AEAATAAPGWSGPTTSPRPNGRWSATGGPVGPRTRPCTRAPAGTSSTRRAPPRCSARTAARASPGNPARSRLLAPAGDGLLDHPDRVQLAEELVGAGLRELLREGPAAGQAVR